MKYGRKEGASAGQGPLIRGASIRDALIQDSLFIIWSSILAIHIHKHPSCLFTSLKDEYRNLYIRLLPSMSWQESNPIFPPTSRLLPPSYYIIFFILSLQTRRRTALKKANRLGKCDEEEMRLPGEEQLDNR